MRASVSGCIEKTEDRGLIADYGVRDADADGREQG